MAPLNAGFRLILIERRHQLQETDPSLKRPCNMFRISQETKEILRESKETVGREVKSLTLPSSEVLSLALDAFALGFIFSTRREFNSLFPCLSSFC